jgi:hypothetical protein
MNPRPKIIRRLIFSCCAAGVLVCGALLAETGGFFAQNASAAGLSQQNQDAVQGGTPQQNQSEQQPQTKESKKEHLKKLSGKLVDAPCMEKGLSSGGGGAGSKDQAGPQASNAVTSAPLAQSRFLGQAGQTPGQAPQVGAGATTSGTQPGQPPRLPRDQYPNQGPPPGPTPAEKQAHFCPATPGTTSFGLVLSDGKFVILDDESNAKAGEALKATTLKQGKAPKAQLRGTLKGGTVKVEEIRIKA